MHLEIIQPTDRIEIVSSEVIDKLYNLAFEDENTGVISQLDSTSNIQGHIQAVSAYEDAVRYLAGIDQGDAKRFPNLTITIPNSNYYIRFEDPKVEEICAKQWGDGIGLSKLAAADVNNIGQVFRKDNKIKTGITKFNEFKYFNNVTTLAAVQDWHDGVFEGCTNLTEITFPSNLINLNGRTFYQCSNLQKVNVENLSIIWSNEFAYAPKLFSGDIAYFKSLTTSGGGMFSGNKNISQVYMPKIQTSYNKGNYSNYYSCSPWIAGGYGGTSTIGLVYLRDITKIYAAAFTNLTCTALIIDNVTPPVLANSYDKTDDEANSSEEKGTAFSSANLGGTGLKIIYVPDEAIGTYRDTDIWRTTCEFRGISELNNGIIYNTREEWINAGKPVALIREYMQ